MSIIDDAKQLAQGVVAGGDGQRRSRSRPTAGCRAASPIR